MRPDPATGRQGACLLAALLAHGLALSLLPMLPTSSIDSGSMPAEHVISARLLTEAPAPASPPAAAPEPPQSAPPPPVPRPQARHATQPPLPRPAPAATSPAFAIPSPPTPAPLIASSSASAAFTAPAANPEPATPAPSSAAGGNTGATSSANAASTATASATARPPGPSAEQAARPDYAYNPKPEYPPMARQFGLTGRVLMRVLVEPDGAPREIVITSSSGHDMLDAAALKSVRAWRFVPARRAGEAYASWVEFPVRFDLTN